MTGGIEALRGQTGSHISSRRPDEGGSRTEGGTRKDLVCAENLTRNDRYQNNDEGREGRMNELDTGAWMNLGGVGEGKKGRERRGG